MDKVVYFDIGSDIDTLCIGPKSVRREDFLEEMYSMLKSQAEVSEITVVPEAFVPIIKLVFSDIHVSRTTPFRPTHTNAVDRFSFRTLINS
jgi:poly(A) polymerase Pap1